MTLLICFIRILSFLALQLTDELLPVSASAESSRVR